MELWRIFTWKEALTFHGRPTSPWIIEGKQIHIDKIHQWNCPKSDFFINSHDGACPSVRNQIVDLSFIVKIVFVAEFYKKKENVMQCSSLLTLFSTLKKVVKYVDHVICGVEWVLVN